MALTKDQVKQVAKLANLSLTNEEEEKYSSQLSKILEYVEKLEAVDTSKSEPTFNVSTQINVTIGDETNLCLSQEEALSNAPEKKEGFFVTKGIFKE